MPRGIYIHKPRSKKTREKIAQSTMGEKNHFYGKHHTEEANEKNRIAHLGHLAWNKGTKGVMPEPWNKGLKAKDNPKVQKNVEAASRAHIGKPLTKEHRQKISNGQVGEKNWNWQGGKSFEPYTSEFNRQLKELIRQRDNYRCRKCGCPEVENMEKLSIHHIDYIKKNCLPSNLISLCRRCNSEVNSNRSKWKQYFEKVNGILSANTPDESVV